LRRLNRTIPRLRQKNGFWNKLRSYDILASVTS
jgi:hypothetical protein